MELKFITPQKEIAFPRIEKDFLSKKPAHAVMFITGLGLYRAFLNGQRVGKDYLTPGWNDYDAYLRYQAYDITALLQESNHLEVWLGQGWYMGRLGTDDGREKIWGSRYLLAVRLEITDIDGHKSVIETDNSWTAKPSSIVSGNIYDGEVRDDTRRSEETVLCEKVKYNYHLMEQFSPTIQAYALLKPTLIITPKGEHVLDFGQNMAGVIQFINRLPYGEKIRIQTGETLQDGCFYRDNLRTARSEFIYTSDGQNKIVEPFFTFFGFRYARIEGLERVDSEDFTAIALSSNLPQTLKTETGHTKLNRLMLNSVWGQRSNFLDVPTDCPQRDERLGWTADAQVFANTACYQMNCKDFYRKYMRDLRAEQERYYHGDIPMYCPSLKGTAGHGGAVWADAAVIIPWNVYMNYGDKALLEENYPMMQSYTEYLIAQDQALGGKHTQFNSFTFGDWLSQDGMTPQSLKGGTDDAYIQGIYYMNAVKLTGNAAEVLGKKRDAEHYAAFAKEIRVALLDEYFSPAGNLTVDTQTGYVLALQYGIFRNREKLLKGFERRLKKDFYRITCGFTGTPFILPVLFDNGMEKTAYRMLLNETFPGWLYAVNLGATTIWERWNSLEADGHISGTSMNSLNHYAYGSVCEAIYSRIMGLQNIAAGWKKVRIAPHIDGRIKHSDITFDSPAGTWRVAWEIEMSGEVMLCVCVPEGAKTDVILPEHPEKMRITVTGGDHEWHWMPKRDYLHPFSTTSIVQDLLENKEAKALLKEKLPDFYALVANPESEFQVLTLQEMAQTMPYLHTEDLAAVEQDLKSIRI